MYQAPYLWKLFQYIWFKERKKIIRKKKIPLIYKIHEQL